jgi:hypothetical protein
VEASAGEVKPFSISDCNFMKGSSGIFCKIVPVTALLGKRFKPVSSTSQAPIPVTTITQVIS